jgi:hypothetical protein
LQHGEKPGGDRKPVRDDAIPAIGATEHEEHVLGHRTSTGGVDANGLKILPGNGLAMSAYDARDAHFVYS